MTLEAEKASTELAPRKPKAMRIDPTAVPPWIDDPQPDTWVPLWIAAKVWFRKSTEWVWKMAVDGTLEEAGFKLFRSGKHWHIKLPVAIPPEAYPKRRGVDNL